MRYLFLIGGMTVAVTLASAQEKITLSVAETKPSNAEYRIERLMLQSDDPATTPADEGVITIQLLGQNGETVSCVYNAASNPTGTFLLTALNKANLSTAYAANATTGSLRQRIFHRLVVMGESTAVCGKTLTGSLAGTVP
jgi:hypothetical protein